MDVCDLKFPDSSFDVVTTVYTLRNFPDLGDALAEMVRVARPGEPSYLNAAARRTPTRARR